tara:strand:+ start:1139 stop:1414 length:276 start_codon:yes stop_codon:yes gene_type:complete
VILDPRNRHLLVELLPEEDEQEKSAVLLPDNYRPVKSPHIAVRLLEKAPDCKIQCSHGSVLIVESSMLNEIVHNSHVFHLVLENYVLGVIE